MWSNKRSLTQRHLRRDRHGGSGGGCRRSRSRFNRLGGGGSRNGGRGSSCRCNGGRSRGRRRGGRDPPDG